MASKYWVGTATPGDVSVAGNWTGGIPGAGDNAIFNAGSQDATTGTLPDCDNVYVLPGYRGNIGPTTAITIGSYTTFQYAGSGNVCNVSVAGGKTIGLFEVDNGRVSVAGTGTITTLLCTTSIVTCNTVVVTNVRGVTTGATISLGTCATAVTLLQAYGPISCENRNITTANVIGKSGILNTLGTTAVTTGNVLSGATYAKMSSATDTTFNADGMGSLITPANNPNPSSTITTANIYSGAAIIKNAAGTVLNGTVNYFGTQNAPLPVDM